MSTKTNFYQKLKFQYEDVFQLEEPVQFEISKDFSNTSEYYQVDSCEKFVSIELDNNDQNNFLSNNNILADKFFCIIESSICVPKDLGSKATDTPVPKIPFEETPTHPVKNKVININIKILNFIF